MAVYDRWHREPAAGEDARPCRCGRGRNRLYPSAVHGRGMRWQVQWENPAQDGPRRLKRNFALRDPAPGELPDPNRHAAAFDREVQGSIVRNDYTDPNAGRVTLREYAEAWRKTRGHSDESAAKLESRLRNHVYEDPARPGSGRSPRGALSVGQHPLSLLGRRKTLAAAWVASLKQALPAERSRRQVVDDVTAVLAAAVEDGIIRVNPLKSSVVDKPGRGGPKAAPFSAAEVAAIAARMPGHLRVLPPLGAGTGMRMMELAALAVEDVQMLGRQPHVRVERQLKKSAGRLVFAPLKNRKPHRVPLAPAVAGALAAHLAQYPAAEVTLPWHDPRDPREHGREVTLRLVLAGAGGGALTRSALWRAWNTAAARAAGVTAADASGHLAVTGRNMHRLRHTYASAQLRAGTDVVRVAAALGDTVEMVVKTYAHLMPEEDGDADLRDAVDAFFGQCAPDVPPEADAGESAQA